MVAECKSKPQIEAALAAAYGPRVLALPSARGFHFAAYRNLSQDPSMFGAPVELWVT